MSVESLLMVFENAEAFEQHSVPAQNSGKNKLLRNDLVGYPILEPFQSVHLIGFVNPLTAEEAKALNSIMSGVSSKLSFKDCSDAFIKGAKMTLLLGGFILDSVPRAGFQLSATPKNFADGAAVALNGNAKNIWNSTSQSGEYEIIDQDDLITEEDLVKPTPTMDCGTNGPVKKACKSCSCGMADLEAKGDAAAEKPKSSCGNCYLGDAFRCGKCPYRGLPAFEPGQQVSIPADFLEDDI